MGIEPLSRRTFLRGAGVAIALPFLDAMVPVARAAENTPRRRMVFMNVGLGLHVPNIIPNKPGRDYEITPYLEPIKDLRDQFTVISGTSHPNVDGGHNAEYSFLTTAPHPGSASFRNTISLDQYAAEKIGSQTRFSSLCLSLFGTGLSWSRSGVSLPSCSRPSLLFAQLFIEGKPEEKKKQIQRLKDGQSVLDMVQGNAKNMSQNLGSSDKAKLDEYLTAVRDAEVRLQKSEGWENKPKPQVTAKQPVDLKDKNDVIGQAELMYDMIHLALQTDSTRIVTFHKNGTNAVPTVKGVSQDYHNLSHHGKDPAKITELAIVEKEQMRCFGDFLRKLQSTEDGDAKLLDNTMVMIGSNLGNASSHDNTNLPIVFAGGGFKHGQHLAFSNEKNEPLGNLFVTMLQRLGIETDSFGTAKTTMKGIEAK